MVRQTIELYHEDPIFGHLGAAKTAARIRMKFWWEGMAKDIERVVWECQQCQETGARKMVVGPTRRLEIPEGPWQRLHYDEGGPFAISKQGHKYFIVVVDAFTKYIVVRPLRSLEAAEVGRALESILVEYGAPKEILTDNLKAHRAENIRQVLEVLKVKRMYSSIRHPQTNGTAEAAVKAVKEYMMKFAGQYKNSWDEMLLAAAAAHNSTVSRVTGETPYYLMFGRDRHDVHGEGAPEGVTPEAWKKLLRIRLDMAWEEARRHSQKEHEDRARAEPEHQEVEKLEPGELVMLWSLHTSVQQDPDLKKAFWNPWDGPRLKGEKGNGWRQCTATD
jgi:transposase InsO family protein